MLVKFDLQICAACGAEIGHDMYNLDHDLGTQLSRVMLTDVCQQGELLG